MATHKLFLLPGDGIGPEVMAEVEKVIAAFRRRGRRAGSRSRRASSAAAPMTRTARRSATPTWRAPHAADAVLLAAVGGPKWDERALRGAARSGPAAPAQGSRPLRQSASGDLLSGARRRLVAQARGGRGARHHDRARTDRRRLFRRAQADHRPRQRPEARRSTRRSTTRSRSSASAASPSTSRASAATR